MKKWEYRIVDSSDVSGSGLFKSVERSAVEAHLNELGREGWEIVCLDFREHEGPLGFSGLAKRERPA